MAAKKKILFLTRQLGQGGTERRLMDLKESLSGHFDIRVHSITGTDLLNDKFTDYWSEISNEWTIEKRIVNLYRLLKGFSPDLVQAFDISAGFFYKIVSAFRRQKPIFISGSGAGMLDDKRMLWLLKRRFFQPQLYVCNSHCGANFIRNVIPFKVEVNVIANGLNKSRFNSLDNSERPFWAEGDHPIIGYIGKLDILKHGERLLEVAKLMLTHPAQPKFVVFGDGPNREQFERDLQGCPAELQSRFFYLGTVHNAARFIPYFTIGTLCSDSEGFPNVLLEYMALGKPWVSTDVGDVAKINEAMYCGNIISNWNAEEFTQRITNLLADKSEYIRLSKNGIANFNQNFTVDVSKINYRKLYESLLSN